MVYKFLDKNPDERLKCDEALEIINDQGLASYKKENEKLRAETEKLIEEISKLKSEVKILSEKNFSSGLCKNC